MDDPGDVDGVLAPILLRHVVGDEKSETTTFIFDDDDDGLCWR